MTMPFPDLWPALPEVILLVVALILLMVGVFRGEGSTIGTDLTLAIRLAGREGYRMEGVWGLEGRQAWDGGCFGLISWAIPMLAGPRYNFYKAIQEQPG